MGHKDMRAAITSGVKEAVNQLVECGRFPTLRDYFAAQALASGRIRMPFENPRPDGGPSPEMQTALEAYRVADAMLAAREKKAEAA
jgi:hypothetical protein